MRLKENKKNFREISFRGFAKNTRETLTSYYNSLTKKFGILPNFSTRLIHLKPLNRRLLEDLETLNIQSNLRWTPAAPEESLPIARVPVTQKGP